MKIQKLDFNISLYVKNICIAALFLGAAILLYACENDIEKIKAFSSAENLPVLEAKNFESLSSDSGQIRIFLKAPKLLSFDNDGVTYYEFPEGMEMIKYDENKQIISSLSAEYAKRFVKEKRWEAKNNVIATNAQGDTLKTEHLIWDEEKEEIYTEEYVKIIRKDQIITGIGFTSDQTLQNWKIKNPKGTLFVTVGNENKVQSDPIDAVSKPGKTESVNKTLQFEK